MRWKLEEWFRGYFTFWSWLKHVDKEIIYQETCSRTEEIDFVPSLILPQVLRHAFFYWVNPFKLNSNLCRKSNSLQQHVPVLPAREWVWPSSPWCRSVSVAGEVIVFARIFTVAAHVPCNWENIKSGEEPVRQCLTILLKLWRRSILLRNAVLWMLLVDSLG